jgi:hypothetical protein
MIELRSSAGLSDKQYNLLNSRSHVVLRDGLAVAEHRIAEVKRTGSTVLNLSDLDLEVLPERIWRLAQLRFLYLNDN